LPPSGAKYSIEEAASLKLAYYDIAVEAVVEEVTPTPISTPTPNGPGTCLWMTELTLRPLRSIWGEIADPSFMALTYRLPTNFRPFDDECASAIEDDLPAPERGARGIFLLTGGHDAPQPFPNIPLLNHVRTGFLTKESDSVTVYMPDGTTPRWAYEEFLSALQEEAGTRTIARMSQEARCIILASLGSRESREVISGDGSPRQVRYPLKVESTYRGVIPDGRLFLTVTSPRKTEWPVDRMIRRLHSKRVLIFGNCSNEGEVVPVQGGVLYVDSEGRLSLPARKISRTAVDTDWKPLSEVEKILR
jgi:hypothetical protein